jgi:hypothetical protein
LKPLFFDAGGGAFQHLQAVPTVGQLADVDYRANSKEFDKQKPFQLVLGFAFVGEFVRCSYGLL